MMHRYRGRKLIRSGFIGLTLMVLIINVGLQPQVLWQMFTAVRHQALFADASAWRFSPAATAQRGEMRPDIAARTAFGMRPALAPDRS